MIRSTAYDPEFYAFSRTLEAYKEGQNKNEERGYWRDVGCRCCGARRRHLLLLHHRMP